MATYNGIQKDSVAEGGEAPEYVKHFLSSMMSDPSKLGDKASADTIPYELAKCVSDFLMKRDKKTELNSTLFTVGVDS